MKKTLPIFAALIMFCAGCWSPNYNKIPLQTSDIPYILADGNYMDNKGNLHPNQHNVWAMSQADVFDYMKYIRNIEPPKDVVDKVSSYTNRIPLDYKVLIFIILVISLITLFVVFKIKISKLKKKLEKIQEEATTLED